MTRASVSVDGGGGVGGGRRAAPPLPWSSASARAGAEKENGDGRVKALGAVGEGAAVGDAAPPVPFPPVGVGERDSGAAAAVKEIAVASTGLAGDAVEAVGEAWESFSGGGSNGSNVVGFGDGGSAVDRNDTLTAFALAGNCGSALK